MTSVCAAGFGCAVAAGPAVSPDEAVLAVLRDGGPLGPQGIGEALQARYGMALKRDGLARVLYRIGAVRSPSGRYAAPEGLPGVAPESETPPGQGGVSSTAA